MSTLARIAIITGAGSSRAYGFPDGPELLAKVAKSPLDFDRSTAHFDSEDFDSWDESFRTRISRCTASSIDELVRENEEDVDFASQCRARIAHQLLNSEERTSLRVDSRPADDWLRLLWSKMREVRTNDWISSVSVMTYNYDRLIEQYFAQGCEATLGLPHDLALSEAARLDVLHLHGSLGQLATATDLTKRRVKWGHTLKLGSLRTLAPELRLYWQMAEDSILEAASTRLANADTLAILGVRAALPRVAELVGRALSKRKSDARMTVLITGLGLSEAERVACRSLFDDPRLNAEAYDDNCSAVLRRITW